jgi:hypothetical protein
MFLVQISLLAVTFYLPYITGLGFINTTTKEVNPHFCIHYNKTRCLFQHPLHYMSFTTINNDWRNNRNPTLRCHGSEVGQQFTCKSVWERLIERAWLWIVKWSIWICQVKMSYVFGVSTEYSQKMTHFFFEFIMKCTYLYTIRHFYTLNIL